MRLLLIAATLLASGLGLAFGLLLCFARFGALTPGLLLSAASAGLALAAILLASDGRRRRPALLQDEQVAPVRQPRPAARGRDAA